MVTTAPKNSRNKRLHIVFFTDASKTKSTSISLKNLAIFSFLCLSFFASAATSLFFYQKTQSQLHSKDEYIRELKSAITSYAVTNEKTQLSMANEADPQTDLMRKIAQEIKDHAKSEKSIAANDSGEDTLASLQSGLSSLSSVSASLARNEQNNDKNQNVNFAKQATNANSTASLTGSEAATRTPPVSQAQGEGTGTAPAAADPSSAGGNGVVVQPGHATEVNGATTIHFQLVNKSPARGHSWTGRVCGVAELSGMTDENSRPAVAMAAKSAPPGFISLPSGRKVESARHPGNSCADGEFVRFSRLRPTELVVPAKQDTIKRVTIFFVESGSNQLFSQPIDL